VTASVVDRRRLVITGVVQGVGFRPFVYRLATEMDLSGSVTNASSAVVVEVSGTPDVLDRFQQRLVGEAPPLALIESVTAEPVGGTATTGRDHGGGGTSSTARFVIAESLGGSAETISVPADTSACAACRAEMWDPANRRYGHPFISCTDCGPRFTIIERLPYDRPSTTMGRFEMCPDCDAEYHDPGDRRFHAQPIACLRCGPILTVDLVGGGSAIDEPVTDPIVAAAGIIAGGGIVVVKGVGGFQLCCDAADDGAVSALRHWKRRPDKPLALLVADASAARHLVDLNEAECHLIESPVRPIVLARRRRSITAGSSVEPRISEDVAPGQPRLGIMLPPSPLHELLAVAAGRPLVLTSGNVSGAPMCFRDEDLHRLLAGATEPSAAADSPAAPVPVAVLSHERPIAVPCDDSVVRVVGRQPIVIRRARGLSPTAVPFRLPGPPVLAVGALLKNTFCLAGTGQAWVSQHIGDLDDLDTVEAFDATVDRFEQFHHTEAEVAAVDAHPDNPGRSWLRRHRPALPVIDVQHHHAHVASVMAEHGRDPTDLVLGVAFDGTGYGTGPAGETQVWGGEFLLATGSAYRRFAHLKSLLLPGGDAAVVNPYRVALAHLHHAGVDPDRLQALASHAEADPAERALLARQLETGFTCLPNSSMGRLFDAVSSIVGLRHRISYEAQGAIELEIAAANHRRVAGAAAAGGEPYRFRLETDATDAIDALVADPGPVIRSVVDDTLAARPVGEIAMKFHQAVVDLIVDVTCRAIGHLPAPRRPTVVLSGGVFQNALLVEVAVDALTSGAIPADTLEVLTNRVVPPNDGGIALGQAYVARSHLL
jgi:hydrogenase maturation protein HypF